MISTGILFSHVLFGILGVLVAAALFMDIVNLNESNLKRIQIMSLIIAGLIVIAYISGGYWYVATYPADKALIKAGPWPWAHDFFMEVKEHIFFILLLLSLYLPAVTLGKRYLELVRYKKLALTVTGFIILLGLTMDGFGAIIAMGVRMGLAGGR
jgi:hypothetical protein